MKQIVLAVSFSVILAANDPLHFTRSCPVEYALMLSIATQERHPERPVGYPYLISLNRSTDQKRAAKLIVNGWLDRRTIDCGSTQGCIEQFRVLRNAGIKNLDVGAFQINTIYHKASEEAYFTLASSYQLACDYLVALNKMYGWSWETIATYHSGTEKFNKPYQARIKHYYKEYTQ